MSRRARGRRATCEGRISVDVRELHRLGLLRAGQRSTCSWIRNGKPLGSIDVRTEADAVVLTLKLRSPASNDRMSIEQRVPVEQRVGLVWTRCHLGGSRPWFRCRTCWRRVAKLYQCGDPVFACRNCCGLVYASQQEIPHYRAISRVQKLRMRLGGSPNLLEPFPKRPLGMHRRTYYRLFNKAALAQERSVALEVEYLRRRYPGVLGR